MLGYKKETATQTPECWQYVWETAQGGFTLDETILAAGTLIKAGTVIGFDEATRKAKVAKLGQLQANATNVTLTYRVNKGSNLAVGHSVNLVGGTTRVITVYDTSNGAYDEFTVGTTIGIAGTAGDPVFVTDDGYTKAKGLLFADTEVPAAGFIQDQVSVVIRGTVYARRVQPVAPLVRALMPNIIFSDSF